MYQFLLQENAVSYLDLNFCVPGLKGRYQSVPWSAWFSRRPYLPPSFFFIIIFLKILMYSRKPSKIEIFMIQISSENHLKYLGCGHVSAQNYSISIKFICLGVYIEVIKSVWSYVCIARKEVHSLFKEI